MFIIVSNPKIVIIKFSFNIKYGPVQCLISCYPIDERVLRMLSVSFQVLHNTTTKNKRQRKKVSRIPQGLLNFMKKFLILIDFISIDFFISAVKNLLPPE